MNKNFIQKSTLYRIFAKITLFTFILTPFLISSKVSAASLPTITGYRSYSVNMNSVSSDGINGGNPNGIIPFTIIGAPPAGSTVIYLTGLNWQFSGAYGNAQNQYNKATVSFLFVQQAENAQMPKTLTKNIPVISSTRTSKGNIVQGNCYFPNENNDSLVVQCDYVTEDYSSFTDFYFQWGSSSIQTQLANIGSMPNVYNTHPISMSIGDIQIISTADPMIAGQNQIINQNNTIINQNQQMITGMEVNNQLQQNQNDFLEQGAQNVQSASDAGGQNANDSQQTNEQATQNIFGAITSVIGVFNTNERNCSIPVVASGVDLGEINFCSGKPPFWTQLVGGVGSIILVYAIYKTALAVFQYFIAMTAFAQGNNKGDNG